LVANDVALSHPQHPPAKALPLNEWRVLRRMRGGSVSKSPAPRFPGTPNSTNRRYGVARVAEEFEVTRSTLYRVRTQRRGTPKGLGATARERHSHEQASGPLLWPAALLP